jgi:hypothetical protein
VDPSLSPEELKKIEEKNRYRRGRRKKTTDYSTALDAKAAGPGGQVMCDRALVHKWLEVANREVPGCGDDKFVIAFAQFGQLGMGGGGIANVGRPDKSITTHEFGHAFSGLLDEYTGNPNPPQGEWANTIQAPNVSTTPDPEKVPWAHMLKKRVKGVDIIEGGATFDKGVWRPAQSCAMNAAGAVGFCPVCREATILVIYGHVSPIDCIAPPEDREVKATEGDETVLSVTPMKPRSHDLQVAWYVASGEEPATGWEPPPDAAGFDPSRFNQLSEYYAGTRGRTARDDYSTPPKGERSRLGAVAKGAHKAHVFPVGKLPPGRYRITAEVRDGTKWVVKDAKNLLAERASWTVEVTPRG